MRPIGSLSRNPHPSSDSSSRGVTHAGGRKKKQHRRPYSKEEWKLIEDDLPDMWNKYGNDRNGIIKRMLELIEKLPADNQKAMIDAHFVNRLISKWAITSAADEDFEIFLDEFESLVLNCLSEQALETLNYKFLGVKPEKVERLLNYENAIKNIFNARSSLASSKETIATDKIETLYKDIEKIKQHPRPQLMIVIMLQISGKHKDFSYLKEKEHKVIRDYFHIPAP